MSGFYKERKLTKEEQAIDRAADKHIDALKDEMLVFKGFFGTWFVGLLFSIFSTENSRFKYFGGALMIVAVLFIPVHILLVKRTKKYRHQARVLMDAYFRKKSLPLFNELTEMFADKPGVHLHINNDGSITVTDKRKAKEKK